MISNEKEEKRIIKFGLIVNFRDHLPTFLHQSYAEFFVAKYTFNKIQNKTNQFDDEIAIGF